MVIFEGEPEGLGEGAGVGNGTGSTTGIGVGTGVPPEDGALGVSAGETVAPGGRTGAGVTKTNGI